MSYLSVTAWCCDECYYLLQVLKGLDFVEYSSLVEKWLADVYAGHEGIDRVVILRAASPQRYGGGSGAGLQLRLPLCDWCERGTDLPDELR